MLSIHANTYSLGICNKDILSIYCLLSDLYRRYEPEDILPINVYLTVVRKSASNPNFRPDTFQKDITPEVSEAALCDKEVSRLSRAIELKLRQPPFVLDHTPDLEVRTHTYANVHSPQKKKSVISLVNRDMSPIGYTFDNWSEVRCCNLIVLSGILSKKCILICNFKLEEKFTSSKVSGKIANMCYFDTNA